MPYIAAMKKLRFLMCQDTVAGDDGFVALSRSQSIENIWGRRCHNLRSRGFVAMANMPKLKTLGVSCLNVDDAALAALPDFPALRELMPMDVPDAGYRHIAKCRDLEVLTLMYCRDTGDGATEHIAALPRLKKYFASYTKITDRTPELLEHDGVIGERRILGVRWADERRRRGARLAAAFARSHTRRNVQRDRGDRVGVSGARARELLADAHAVNVIST